MRPRVQSVSVSDQQSSPICEALDIRSISIDDLANARALHIISLRALASEHLEEEEIAAMIVAFNEPRYAETLLRSHPVAAWLDGRMVATAGWLRTVDRNAIARIEHVYVDPLFVKLGIGRRMVGHVEAMARLAGFSQFSARPTFNAVHFFEKLGYRTSSFGVRTVSRTVGLPIAHMRQGGEFEVHEAVGTVRSSISMPAAIGDDDSDLPPETLAFRAELARSD